MNAKSRQKILNAAFKQFQRLPDWPLGKTSPALPAPVWKLHMLPKPGSGLADGSRPQSFPE
jgi:hypothetical protein